MGLYDVFFELEIPGLEAIYTIQRSGASGSNSVRLNDRLMLERYEVDSIDGLFDTVPIRESREAKPDGPGGERGRQQIGERVVAYTGTTFAGSFGKLRELERDLERISGPDVDPLNPDDVTLRIDPIDYELRRNLNTSFFYNWLLNGSFLLGAVDWTNTGFTTFDTATAAFASQLGTTAARLASSPGVGSTHVLKAHSSLTSWNTKMPIRGGGSWLLTALFSVTAITGTVNLGVRLTFFDANNNSVGVTTAAAIAATGLARATAIGVAPAYARYAQVEIIATGGASGGTIDAKVSNVMLGEGATPRHTVETFVPGCALSTIGFPIGPRNHNLIFDANLAGANSTTGLAAAGDVGYGDSRRMHVASDLNLANPASLLLDATDLGNADFDSGAGDRAWILTKTVSTGVARANSTIAVPVVELARYAVSFRCMPVGNYANTVRVGMVWSDKAGSTISTALSTAIPEVVGATVLPASEFIAPAGAITARPFVEVVSAVSGEQRVISQPMMKAGTLDEFGNGDYPGWEWSGATDASSSQRKALDSYVIEKIDVDVKQGEKQDSRERKRPFLLTLKCRDPRIYRNRTKAVSFVAGASYPSYVILPNPGLFAGTVDETMNSYTINTAKGYTWLSGYGAGFDPRLIFCPNASVLASTRFAQIEARFGLVGNPLFVANTDGVVLEFRRIDALNHLRWFIDAQGTISLLKNDAGTVSVILGTGGLGPSFSFSPIYERQFWAKTWVGAANLITLAIYYENPINPNAVPDYTFTYTLTAGNATKYGTAINGKGGWGMQKDTDSSVIPQILTYEEGDIGATPFISNAVAIGGEIQTPGLFKITGPITFPSIQMPGSGLYVYTDAVMSAGQTLTIGEDGEVGGTLAATQDVLLTGTTLGDMIPLSTQNLILAGQGITSGQTKIDLSWREALK